jgi:hypothetical protein
MTISRILELYARSGRSLEDMGLKEAALDLSEAGQALDLFAGQKLLVLGGDVYRASNGPTKRGSESLKASPQRLTKATPSRSPTNAMSGFFARFVKRK